MALDGQPKWLEIEKKNHNKGVDQIEVRVHPGLCPIGSCFWVSHLTLWAWAW